MKDKDNKFKEKLLENTVAQYSEIAQYPDSILIELTNACNHACLFCSHRKMTRKVTSLDFDFACRILKEAYDLGVRQVGLFMGGESLLYKQLENIVKFCKETGFNYVYITTNGALADTDRMKKLVEAGLDSVKFSFNAASKEGYQLIHGRDDFDSVLKNIKDFYNYRQISKKKCNIFISSVTTRYNDSSEKIEKLLGDYCDSLAIYQAGNADGLVPEVDELLRNENETYDIQNQRTTPCFLPFNCFHITAEGYLTACCLDLFNNLAYADLNSTTLKEAWNNSVIRELRRKHLSNEIEGTLCENCVNHTKKQVYPLDQILASSINEQILNDFSETTSRISEYERKINQ